MYTSKVVLLVLLQVWSTAWVRPPVGQLKLNIDAAMLKDPTVVGVGMVLRDSDGLLVACKSVVLPFRCFVKEAEAASLREGLQWLLELHHFEVDVAKIVVEDFTRSPLLLMSLDALSVIVEVWLLIVIFLFSL